MSYTQTQSTCPLGYGTTRRRTLSTTLYAVPQTTHEEPTTQTKELETCPAQLQFTGESIEKSSEPETSFQTLHPIMARLPLDNAAASVGEDQPRFEDPYFRTAATAIIPGGLAYDPNHEGVLYTRSRLPELDEAGRAIWTSLHKFRSLTADYAGNFQCRARKTRQEDSKCPMSTKSDTALDLVRRVFNWSALTMPVDTDAEYFGVVFRSKRAEGSESQNLMMADKLSHEEAVNQGGLLMYWYGVPDPASGSNLATCIWRTQEEAKVASALPLHKEAVKHARVAYADFELSRYKVVKRAGEVGVHVEEWA